MNKALLICVVAGLSMYGCGDDTTPMMDGGDDATVDSSVMDGSVPDADATPPDAMMDGSADAMMDGAADAMMDGSADAMMDGAADAMMDATADAMMDGAADAMMDATADAMMDATADAMMDATVDAGPPGGGAATSTQIQAVRDAAPGSVTLPVDDAIVTYTKPITGSDPAGFFVQAEQMGPAIFVAIDPASLSPVPDIGSVVSFQVDETAANQGRAEVTMISSFTEASNGHDVEFLVQEVSAATDLVSALDSYESELLRLTGDLGSFGFGGTGHTAAPIATAGIPSDTNLRLRVPTTLRASSDLAAACRVTMTGPMWRFNNTAQPSVYFDAEIVVDSCPAPEVVSAAATSLTEVDVTFDRLIDDASITAAATQFIITAGLTVSAASSGGTNVVTLTTSAQTPGTMYTVTVADTVTDMLGAGVLATANTADFTGFSTPAVVRINEFTADISGHCDLMELRVISGGTMGGFRLMERTSGVFTFPMGFNVSTNDLIVVHFRTNDAACNATGATSETTAIDELPESAHPQNYDTAFDFYSTDTGLTSTDNVFQIRDGAMTIVDAVLASDDVGGTAAAASETAAAAVAAAGEWEAIGGGVPAGGFVDDVFSVNAAQDLNATTAAGESIQRLNDADTNQAGDFTQATTSYGALNAGQTAF